jgi:hypothetical protein
VELVPGGREVKVTEANKHEYVNLIARHRMTTSIKAQIQVRCCLKNWCMFVLGLYVQLNLLPCLPGRSCCAACLHCAIDKNLSPGSLYMQSAGHAAWMTRVPPCPPPFG